MKSFKNILGKKFNNLLVLKIDVKDSSGHYKWICKCDCGNLLSTRGSSLTNGGTKSCGCLKIGKRYKHGMCFTRFYRIWTGIKTRCLNKNFSEFRLYGGRGISIDIKWLKFDNFYNDMYESYLNHIKEFSEKNTSIDRIDNDGNYSKENCRWATSKIQANNRRVRSCFKLFKS